MDILILKSFCRDPESDGRYSLSEPFAQGGWMYATNGVVCIRMKTNEPNETKREVPKNMSFHFFSKHFGPKAPFPTVEVIEKEIACITCFGTGDHNCYCDHCEAKCEDCEGSGKDTQWTPEEIKLGKTTLLGPRHVKLMQQLSNIEYYVNTLDGAPGQFLAFEFEGGQGVIMPCNRYDHKEEERKTNTSGT